MKYVACALIAVFAVAEAGAVETATAPKINPDYVRWAHIKRLREERPISKAQNKLQTKLSKNSVSAEESLDVSVGWRPSPIDRSYLREQCWVTPQAIQSSMGVTEELPPDFDLRVVGRVSPTVKNQNPYGTCWAHATDAALESWCLTNGDGPFDFSEKHQANMHGWDWQPDDGGNLHVAAAYLTRWAGPVAEADDPYPPYSDFIDWLNADIANYFAYLYYGEKPPFPKSSDCNPVGHVQQIRWLAPLSVSDDAKTVKTELVSLKRAIMRYGALYVSYYHVNDFYGSYAGHENATYYFNEDWQRYSYNGIGGGHAVAIVGWDDKFPKGNFLKTPPADGAFIVKNSWGESWGIDGYFYVSYYDHVFARQELGVFANLEKVDNYGTIYQYDPCGYIDNYAFPAGGGKYYVAAYGANVFVAKGNETIAAIGFYANVPSTEYKIEIYSDCQNSNPRTGKLLMSKPQEGTTGDCSGFYTIPLSEEVKISMGKRFSVVMYIRTPKYAGPLAYEAQGYRDGSGAYRILASEASANKGESFCSYDGETWYDFTTQVDPSANFCLKAYTKSETSKRTLAKISLNGDISVASEGTLKIDCKAEYSDGYSVGVNPTRWELDSVGKVYVKGISDEGLITANKVYENQRVKVTAFYSETGTKEFSDSWTFDITAGKPDTPTGLTATQGTKENGIGLAWNPVSGTSKYAIWRSSSGLAENAAYRSETPLTHWEDEEVEPGKNFTYFVVAKNSVNQTSEMSEPATGWRALSAPEGVTASDGTSLEHVEITWTAAPGAKYYHVYRSDVIDGEKSPLGSWQSETIYRDTTATPGKVYYYYVKSAIDSRGNMASDYSIFDDGYVGVPVTLDYLTIDGSATIVSGGNETYTCTATYTDKSTKPVSPTWTIRTGSAYASVDSSGKVTAKTASANQQVTLQASYTDGVNRKTTKQITVTATIPPAPSSVTLKSATTEAVTINWSSVEGAAGYSVWRGSTTADAKKIADVGTATEYADKNGTPGVSCKYWVKASNAAGESDFSAMSVTAGRGLAAPTGVVASDGTYTDKTLISWKPVTGATHYRVARAGSSTGSKTDLGSWQTATSYEDKSGAAGTHYWYFVKAAMSSGGANASAYSASDEGWRMVAVTLASIEISGATKLAAGGSTVLSCTATYSSGSPKTVRPEWSVSPTTAATIDADGKLTAKNVTENVTVTVTARFTDGTTKSDTHEIVIVAPIVATAEVKNVQAKTRWPFSNFLDVDYELVTQPAGTRALVTLSGRDDDKGVAMAARSLTGDGATGPVEAGKHRLTWDVAADYPDFHTKAFSVEMSAVAMSANMPSNVTASAGTSTAGVNIGWAKIDDATGYEVWRNTSSVTNGAVRIQTTDQIVYTDTSAKAGTTYYYWVRSVTPDGTSDFGKPVSGWRAYADIIVAFNGNGGAPSYGSKTYSPTKTYGSLPTASRTGYDFDGWYTASSGGTKVTTSSTVPTSAHVLWAHWTAHTYTIRFDANGGSGSMSNLAMTYDVAKSLPVNVFTKMGYDFAGWSTSSSGSVEYIDGCSVINLASSDSAIVTLYAIWTSNLPPAPAIPSNVNATDGIYTDKVTVSWDTVTGADSYNVYRCTSDSSASAILIGSTSSISYADALASPGVSYYYWVEAVNTAGTSGWSLSNGGYRKLAAPTDFTSSSSMSSASISWKAVPGATSYRVYRSTSSSSTKVLVGTVSKTTYADITGIPGKDYYYWVVAVCDTCQSVEGHSIVAYKKLSAPVLKQSQADAWGCTGVASTPEGAVKIVIYYQNQSTGWQAKVLREENWFYHQYGQPTQYWAVAIGENGSMSAQSSVVQLN